jgi:hypothetical protein
VSLDDLLASARSEADPEPGVRDRVRERLRVAPQGATGGLPARAWPLRAAGARISWGVLGLCAGFALGRAHEIEKPQAPSALPLEAARASRPATVQATRAPELPAPLPRRDAGVRAPGAAASFNAMDAGSSSAGAAVAPTVGPSAGRIATSRRMRNAALRGLGQASGGQRADAERLREALLYLKRAHAALRAGEPARALRLLAELDARVPRAVLGEEREVTRALAHCDAGEPAQAERVARELLLATPRSVYAESLAESCVGRERLLDAMHERTSKPGR